MPAKELTKTDSYKSLVSNIRQALAELEFLIKNKTVKTYWRVGKYINEHLLENKDRAGYGDHLFEDLAADLPASKRTLERSAQFYRTYPIASNLAELGWSHFVFLLSVEDQTQRKLLEQQAVEHNWKLAELKKSIEELKEKEPKQPVEIPQLAFTRGRLNCYRLLEPAVLPGGQKSKVLIDLGFRMRQEFPQADDIGLRAGDCIEVIQKSKSYSFKKISVAQEELFTYAVKVQKVIDGDTLWALIDAGFGRLIQQKLRLRAIDCPELSTPQGQRAKRFVQEKLRNLDFIVIKSYKDTVDKYDRYLVDLFFLKEEKNPKKALEEGTFLNQELLDKKLASLI